MSRWLRFYFKNIIIERKIFFFHTYVPIDLLGLRGIDKKKKKNVYASGVGANCGMSVENFYSLQKHVLVTRGRISFINETSANNW